MSNQKLSRLGFLLVFILLTLPILPWLAGFFGPLRPLFAIDLFLRAIPLYLAWLADRVFLDAGELSPQLIPLWVALTGLLLWPLLALALRPKLMLARRWRRIFGGYTAAFVTLTCGASVWVFTHLGIFF